MDAPTPDEVREWAPAQFLWAEYGYGAGDPDRLAKPIEWIAGELFAVTGRTLESITSPEETAIAEKAIVVLAMTQAMGGGAAALAVMEAPWLKSFTAGSYSETRFSPAELAGNGKGAPPYPIPLWNLLWALMTDAKREEWLERLSGQVAPAGGFFEHDWSGDPTGERAWPS
jgi:hypothetical protein